MSNPYHSASDEAEILRTILRAENEGLRAECADLQNEIERLRTIMAEAAKQDPVTCRKWIRDALP